MRHNARPMISSMIPHVWNRELASYADHLRAGGRPETTIKLRTYQLRRFAREVGRPPAAIDAEMIEAWLGAAHWSQDTRRSFRGALRAFFAWRRSSGRASTDPAAGLPVISAPQGKPRPAGEDALRAALATADARDRLMLRLGAYAGLRCCEIATVRGDALERDLLGWSLRVRGKGGKVRIVPLDNETARQIEARGPGWTFPGLIDGHLSPAYVSKLLSRALPDGVTGHMLRHRFASVAYARGGRDLLAVRDLLGHASVATTQVYTAIPDDSLRRAALAAAA